KPTIRQSCRSRSLSVREAALEGAATEGARATRRRRGDADVGQGRGGPPAGRETSAMRRVVRLRSTTAKGSGSGPGTLPNRGSGQAEPSCAAQQVFNRGGMPSRSAARRPFMHGLELGGDLLQRPVGRGRLDARVSLFLRRFSWALSRSVSWRSSP